LGAGSQRRHRVPFCGRERRTAGRAGRRAGAKERRGHRRGRDAIHVCRQQGNAQRSDRDDQRGRPGGHRLVATLAQPAGNVTGTAYTVGSETFGKGLALIREVVPGVRHVAILSNPANAAQPLAIENIKLAAQPLGVRLLLLEAKRAAELDDVFAAIAKERAEALLVVTEALFIQNSPRPPSSIGFQRCSVPRRT
jgi:hypothetical protein